MELEMSVALLIDFSRVKITNADCCGARMKIISG
jgi:hypothetical protein